MFGRKPTPAPQPTHAFCEPVTAVPFGRWHIRTLTPAGLKLGGGADTPTLCGRDLHGGWDLQAPVTDDKIESLLRPEPNTGREAVCLACVEAYRSQP